MRKKQASLKPSRIKKKLLFKWSYLPYFSSTLLSTLALFLFFGAVLFTKPRIERMAEVYLVEGLLTNGGFENLRIGDNNLVVNGDFEEVASPIPSSTPSPSPYCGNGYLDPGEECDPPGCSRDSGQSCDDVNPCCGGPREMPDRKAECEWDDMSDAYRCVGNGIVCPKGGICQTDCTCP